MYNLNSLLYLFHDFIILLSGRNPLYNMVELLDDLKQFEDVYVQKRNEVFRRLEDLKPTLFSALGKWYELLYELIWNEALFAKEVFDRLYQEFGFHEFRDGVNKLDQALGVINSLKDKYVSALKDPQKFEALIHSTNVQEFSKDLSDLFSALFKISQYSHDALIKIRELELKFGKSSNSNR